MTQLFIARTAALTSADSSTKDAATKFYTFVAKIHGYSIHSIINLRLYAVPASSNLWKIAPPMGFRVTQNPQLAIPAQQRLRPASQLKGERGLRIADRELPRAQSVFLRGFQIG